VKVLYPPGFDEFIAIDWSGATGVYNGIAVATCQPGDGAPVLVKPPHTRWTRSDIAVWLTRQLATGKRYLCGLDFAFSFPFEEPCGYLGGASGIDEIFSFWALVDRTSSVDADFGCASFVHHPDYAHLFWLRSTRPAAWISRKRFTETVCANMTGTYPDTVYKMIGAKQVGKASLTGIRVLHQVRSQNQGLAIWPFEDVRQSAFVEIYPTLFRMLATRSIEKVRSWSALNAALKKFGSRPTRRLRRAPTDHETDALLSAAGLRALAHKRELWDLPGVTSPRIRREGWIFGVHSFTCSKGGMVAS